MIYGTAWKEGETARLVRLALDAGFRAIDTANQKKHYREDIAGEALTPSELARRGLGRADLFLQSKYTYKEGQDHRLPYDPTAGYADQVRASFESSLKNLHTDYLDSYLLHGPRTSQGLTDGDWEVWGAMEELHRSGRARQIGVSNVALPQLKLLFEKARVKPHAVQNRCYAIHGWDRAVRGFCRENGIVYQGFSLLTANPRVVGHPVVAGIARELGVTAEQTIFAFTRAIGILPLTGTTDPVHMKEDLASGSLEPTPGQIEAISAL